ncbi:unnamed protein product, partial [Tuber aestivum]
MVAGRLCLAKASGMASPERSSCGRNGIEANGAEEWPVGEEVRWRSKPGQERSVSIGFPGIRG